MNSTVYGSENREGGCRGWIGHRSLVLTLWVGLMGGVAWAEADHKKDGRATEGERSAQERELIRSELTEIDMRLRRLRQQGDPDRQVDDLRRRRRTLQRKWRSLLRPKGVDRALDSEEVHSERAGRPRPGPLGIRDHSPDSLESGLQRVEMALQALQERGLSRGPEVQALRAIKQRLLRRLQASREADQGRRSDAIDRRDLPASGGRRRGRPARDRSSDRVASPNDTSNDLRDEKRPGWSKSAGRESWVTHKSDSSVGQSESRSEAADPRPARRPSVPRMGLAPEEAAARSRRLRLMARAEDVRFAIKDIGQTSPDRSRRLQIELESIEREMSELAQQTSVSRPTTFAAPTTSAYPQAVDWQQEAQRLQGRVDQMSKEIRELQTLLERLMRVYERDTQVTR